MDHPGELLRHGTRFVREHPQLLYTFFLLIAIPAAFLYTSERFIAIARDNQDRLEYSRVSMLHDGIVVFAGDFFFDKESLRAKIGRVLAINPPIVALDIVMPERSETGTTYARWLSFASTEGTAYPIDTPETDGLFRLAVADPDHSFHEIVSVDGVRVWRSARAITQRGVTLGFLVTDIATPEADRVLRERMTSAYITLGVIVFLILFLLARQARIIDYATLYRRLKEIDEVKDDFVAMAAHELRSPLAIIRAYLDALHAEKELSDGARAIVKRADNAAQDLNHLVGDILDVARLQEGRMSFNLEFFDPSETIGAVIENFAPLAADKKIELRHTPATLAPIFADRDRLRQVLVNLIGNAIKYTPSGSVSIKTSVLPDGKVEIRVSDTGIGISAEDQGKLFQKFFRVKNLETERITGTGLGLWITGEIVRAMRGAINVESIRGKGSDFIVTFPVQK